MEKTVQGWNSRSCPIIRLVQIYLLEFFFIKREYLERQAKAEAFKAGEEIDEAIKTVQNAGEKLKATAEEAKNSLEAKTGSNNGDAGLVPSIWMLVLLPRMMV